MRITLVVITLIYGPMLGYLGYVYYLAVNGGMVGTWTGVWRGGGYAHYEWVIDRSADGTFKGHYKIADFKCWDESDSYEEGVWEFRWGRFIAKSELSNGVPSDFETSYISLYLSNTKHVYLYIDELRFGNLTVFTADRVTSGFKPRGCGAKTHDGPRPRSNVREFNFIFRSEPSE